MAFTRFHDDPYRIQKQVEESIYAGAYTVNTPGPGTNLPFIEDTQIRIQKWGANLQTNTVNLESDLFGLTRTMNRDLVGFNDYKLNSVDTNRVMYSNAVPFVEESRASHPAWMYRDLDLYSFHPPITDPNEKNLSHSELRNGLEQSRWENPLLNPQNDIEMKFNNNIQTRILEKDYFVPRIPVIQGFQP
jgi:hypothetical protein